MARIWVKPAGGTGGYPSEGNREGDCEDPRGVLLSVERLVVSAGESVRRLRQVESAPWGLGGDWADDGALGEMAAQLNDVRGRLMRLRDQVRQAGWDTPGDRGTPAPDRTG